MAMTKEYCLTKCQMVVILIIIMLAGELNIIMIKQAYIFKVMLQLSLIHILPLKDSGWHLVSLEYIGHSGVNGTAMQMVLKKIGHGQKVNREQAVSTLRETEGVRFVVEM